MRSKTSSLIRSILKTAVYLMDQSRDAAADARDHVATGFDRAGDRISDFGARARDRVSGIRDQARDLYAGDDHTLRSVLMFAAGVGVGVGAGLLLAPASGQETRGAIGDKVQEFRGQVRDRFSSRASATGTE